MKPLLSALLLCVATASAAAPCSVKWKDGHDAAIERAFNFEIRLAEGRGECFVHGLAFMASAANDAPVTCEVAFFAGAVVKQGWDLTILADSASFERVATALAATPPVLRVKARPGETLRFVPSRIEVSGPAGCTQWLDALAPARGGTP